MPAKYVENTVVDLWQKSKQENVHTEIKKKKIWMVRLHFDKANGYC